jgi:hypothetical protein
LETFLDTSLSSPEFLGNIIQVLCPEHESVVLPELETRSASSSQAFEDLLSEQWDSVQGPKQPIAIQYCSQLLSQDDSYSGILFQWAESRFPKVGCNAQVALVMGRRFNTEKDRCEVLVRDSTKLNDIWVGTDSLAQNSFQFYFLKN